MRETVLRQSEKYPEIRAEKSFLKQLQMFSRTPSSSLMKDLKPLLMKLLKTLRNRYQEGEPTHIGGGTFGQIFAVKPLSSNLPLALKVQLNQDDETIAQIDREKAIAEKVRLLLMEEFYSGTIPLFDSLQFISEDEVIFICQEMGVEDESLEDEMKQRHKGGRAFTYFSMQRDLSMPAQDAHQPHRASRFEARQRALVPQDR